MSATASGAHRRLGGGGVRAGGAFGAVRIADGGGYRAPDDRSGRDTARRAAQPARTDASDAPTARGWRRLPGTDYRVQPKYMDMLNLGEAWQFGRGAGVKVAIIDTGVTPHPRLPNLIGGGDYRAGRRRRPVGLRRPRHVGGVADRRGTGRRQDRRFRRRGSAGAPKRCPPLKRRHRRRRHRRRR